jgi:hypothetical protein
VDGQQQTAFLEALQDLFGAVAGLEIVTDGTNLGNRGDIPRMADDRAPGILQRISASKDVQNLA